MAKKQAKATPKAVKKPSKAKLTPKAAKKAPPKAAKKPASSPKPSKARPKAAPKAAAKPSPKPAPGLKAKPSKVAPQPSRPARVPEPKPLQRQRAPKQTAEAKSQSKAAVYVPTLPQPFSGSSRSIPTPSVVSPISSGIRYLTLEELVELHVAIDREVGGRNASPGVVESQFGLVRAVQVPQATFLGREAYAAFSDKAAVLFWGIVKDRPFKDGNRRVALVALIVFCELNGATIDPKVLDERKLELMTKKAASHRDDGVAPEAMFGEIRNVLRLAIRRPVQGK